MVGLVGDSPAIMHHFCADGGDAGWWLVDQWVVDVLGGGDGFGCRPKRTGYPPE